MRKQYLEIGKIVTTHALKGEVRVQPWCDDADFLCEFDTLYLRDGAGYRPIAGRSARPHKNVAVLQLEGVDTVEQAAGLRGAVLYMNRDDVELDEDTFFIQDIIGLSVYDADTGALYGRLEDVTQTGANDVYLVRAEDGREYLVPAIIEVIVRTDLDAGRLDIRPLKGLFTDED